MVPASTDILEALLLPKEKAVRWGQEGGYGRNMKLRASHKLTQ